MCVKHVIGAVDVIVHFNPSRTYGYSDDWGLDVEYLISDKLVSEHPRYV